MSDEDAFLRKLLDNPADDTVRLVYADWLDERGQSADAQKSEFLRLEAEIETVIKPRRKKIRKRLQELAANLDTKWLTVVSKLHIENCLAGGTQVRYSGIGQNRIPPYYCPKKWEQLQTTEMSDERFCSNCEEVVYYCDTIQAGRFHVSQNHCVAVDLGVIRKSNDLQPDMRRNMVGRIGPDFFDREEERLRLDAVSESRERAKEQVKNDG